MNSNSETIINFLPKQFLTSKSQNKLSLPDNLHTHNSLKGNKAIEASYFLYSISNINPDQLRVKSGSTPREIRDYPGNNICFKPPKNEKSPLKYIVLMLKKKEIKS